MNFKHLYYFWVTARAGGVVKAGEQLHTTPQTLSTQIKLLEDRLGRRLFRKSGRKLELTDDGRVALRYADDIFALGGDLETAMRERRDNHAATLEFRVGIEDVLAKTVAYHLLTPALDLAQPVRLVCVEGQFDDLMAQLALHRLDLVLSDEPLTSRLSVKAFNHTLGSSTMSFLCTAALRRQIGSEFPQCLDDAPMLLPGGSSSVRPLVDAWLAQHGLRPRVVAEFNDSALMQAFGREGRGVFIAPALVEAEICTRSGVEVLGRSDDLVEDFYAISVERRIRHPCVAAITSAARGTLFG
ncbi:MAG: transcriptional activator NhaR [Leptothrix sp. (in: Bacteria)]|nr:transcriptional activator NhaR [Leptothrix sp. (in: b-proteobacteria)]